MQSYTVSLRTRKASERNLAWEPISVSRARAQAWIDFTNEAFRLNAIPLSLRLVYFGPSIDLLPAGATGDVFDAFSRSAAATDVARQYGADLRHLLYSQDARPGLDNCGRGPLLGDVAVSGFECGQHLFAHEIGHNFGAHHDRANVQSAGTAGAYNYGYVCGGRGTIMSYAGAGRVDHFSSPLLSFGGEPCGVAIGQPDAEFNGAVIDLNRMRVETLRQPQLTFGSVRFAQSAISVHENGQAGRDYAARSGQITLANGAAGTALEIPMMSDGSIVADRTFTVTLSGDSLGAPTTNSATVTHRSSARSDGRGRGGGGGGMSPAVLCGLIVVFALRASRSSRRSIRSA